MPFSVANSFAGKTLQGPSGSYFGFSTAGGPGFDPNNDGFTDVLVGAYLQGNGTAYLFRGEGAYCAGHSVETAAGLTPATGVQFDGPEPGAQFGRVVARAGDPNGDGIQDFIVTAPQAAGGRGRSWIVKGRTDLTNVTPVQITSLTAPNAVEVLGANPSDNSGAAAAGVGRWTNDLFDDVVVCAPNDGAGKCTVLHGSPTFFNQGTVDLSAPNPVTTTTLQGTTPGDGFGTAVTGVDLDGDGFTDIVVSAPGVKRFGITPIGNTYVYCGGATPGTRGHTYEGLGPRHGIALSAAGPNGAGYNSVLIGDDAALSNAGQVVRVEGSAGICSAGTTNLANANLPGVTKFNGPAGGSVGLGVGVSDFDNTGCDNPLLGARNTDSGRGTTYVMTCDPSKATTGTVLLNNLDPGVGSTFVGANTNDGFGIAVTGVGTLDGGALQGTAMSSYLTDETYVFCGDQFTWNTAPLDTDRNKTTYILPKHVNVSSQRYPTSSFQYRFKDVTQGQVLLGHNPPVATNAFSHKNVTDRQVRFRVDDSETAPTLNLEVQTPLSAQTRPVTVNYDPTKSLYPPAMSLAQLADGQSGVKLTGAQTGTQWGISAAGGVDPDGDGFDNVFVGAYLEDPNGPNSGQVLSATNVNTFAATTPIGGLTSPNTFFDGQTAGDRTGVVVGPIGDFDGDGNANDFFMCSDLAAGTAGRMTIGYGGATFASPFDLSGCTGTQCSHVVGINSGDRACAAADGVGGSFVGDGFDGVIIGQPNANPSGSNSGRTSIFHGRNTHAASYGLGTVSNTTVTHYNGVAMGDESGKAVAGLGFFNDDAFADAVTCSPSALGGRGQCHLLYGQANPQPMYNLGGLTPTEGTTVLGPVGTGAAGTAVAGGGDVNGDGFNDVVIGSPGLAQAHVVLGGTLSGPVILGAGVPGKTCLLEGTGIGGQMGAAVSILGDVNGDGFDDIGVCAPTANPGGVPNAGQCAVVFGGGDFCDLGFVDLNTLDGLKGYTLIGPTPNDEYGNAIQGVGDVNNDGVADYAVCAVKADGNTGECTLVYGEKAPSFVKKSAVVNDGKALPLTTSQLDATSHLINNGQIKLTVAQADGVQFEYKDVPGVALTEFFMSEINANADLSRVRLIPITGFTGTPKVELRAKGANAQTPAIPMDLTLNFIPKVVQNQITLGEGERKLLTTAMLSATDQDGDPVTFVITQDDHGNFEWKNGTATQGFTEQDIIDGNVFVHQNGDEEPFDFRFYVTDGKGDSPIQQGIVIPTTKVNDPPQILRARVDVEYPGQRVPLDNNNFEIFDPDNNANEVTFQWAKNVTQGEYLEKNPLRQTFEISQADYEREGAFFQHQGSSAPTSWVRSCDLPGPDQQCSAWQQVEMTYNPQGKNPNTSSALVDESILPRVIGVSVLGLLACLCVAARLCCTYKAKKAIKKAVDLPNGTLHDEYTADHFSDEVFNAIFRRVATTGVVYGTLKERRITAYQNAVTQVIHYLTTGPDALASDMLENKGKRKLLLSLIGDKTKDIYKLKVKKQRNWCLNTLRRAVKPQLSPQQVTDNAKEIAEDVKAAWDQAHARPVEGISMDAFMADGGIQLARLGPQKAAQPASLDLGVGASSGLYDNSWNFFQARVEDLEARLAKVEGREVQGSGHAANDEEKPLLAVNNSMSGASSS